MLDLLRRKLTFVLFILFLSLVYLKYSHAIVFLGSGSNLKYSSDWTSEFITWKFNYQPNNSLIQANGDCGSNCNSYYLENLDTVNTTLRSTYPVEGNGRLDTSFQNSNLDLRCYQENVECVSNSCNIFSGPYFGAGCSTNSDCTDCGKLSSQGVDSTFFGCFVAASSAAQGSTIIGNRGGSTGYGMELDGNYRPRCKWRGGGTGRNNLLATSSVQDFSSCTNNSCSQNSSITCSKNTDCYTPKHVACYHNAANNTATNILVAASSEDSNTFSNSSGTGADYFRVAQASGSASGLISSYLDECFVWLSDSSVTGYRDITDADVCKICSTGVDGKLASCDETNPSNYAPCTTNSDCRGPGICVLTSSTQPTCGSNTCCMGRLESHCSGCTLPACDETPPPSLF